MIPFSGSDFFVAMGLAIALLWICRLTPLKRFYKETLFILNLGFLVILFPNPALFIGFILYSYAFTWLLGMRYPPRYKLIGILVLLLPMLLVKFDIRFSSYPFKLNNLISFAGLSYACFRTMSFYMDKDPKAPMPDLISYFNYLSFTPTLLIGPIDRYSHFRASQETATERLTAGFFIESTETFIRGVVYKYIVAEIINRHVLHVLHAESTAALDMAGNMYAYYAYLFFDFAGYSAMAIGLGGMMGMRVPQNFTNPFLSVNPQDFWKRFHISLGAWLKDYFFTPLFLWMSRFKRLKPHSLFKQNSALVLTFLLMGCWNGFQKHFILSGLLFGLYSAIHNSYVVSCRKAGRDVVFGEMDPRLVRILSIFIMLNLVAFSLYIFSGRCPLI